MNTHDGFMQRCYELAEIARSEGESPVGSVVVKDGVILGEGSEKSRQLRDITRHAEVVAILDALKNSGSLEGTTLYTNVEPCALCSYMIRHHKIKTVVYVKACAELGGTCHPEKLLTTNDISSWGTAPEIIQL